MGNNDNGSFATDTSDSSLESTNTESSDIFFYINSSETFFLPGNPYEENKYLFEMQEYEIIGTVNR